MILDKIVLRCWLSQSKRDWIDIGLKAAAFATFSASVLMLWAAIENNKTTADLLTEIGKLVESNTKQLETLNQQLEVENQAVLELAHQTIVQSYDSEGKHSVKLVSCNYDNSNQQITYQLKILDDRGLPTKISFDVKTNWSYYTNSENVKDTKYPLHDGTEQIIKPGSEKKFVLNISDIIEKIDENSNQLYVRPQYSFAPYSEIKKIILSDYVSQIEEEGLLIGLEKNTFDDKWVMISQNIKSLCK